MAKSAFVAILALSVGACGSSDGGSAPDPGPVPDVAPAQPVLPRLTISQYQNAVADVLGSDVVVPTNLEPDRPSDGLLAIGAARTTISARGVEQYESAAYAIASQVVASDMRGRLGDCTPSATADRDCAEQLLAPVGRRLWRRPLTGDEIAVLLDIFDQSATALGDFYAGLEFAMAALLQSPNFLFRVEVGEPDPGDPSRLRYTNYEMASRLSFLLWNTTPDDELLDAAERGELTTDEGLRANVGRLLQSDRARVGVRQLFSDMYGLYELDSLSKDPTLFTHMGPDVGPAAREETLRVVEDLVFDQQGDFRDLFTTRKTFVNRKLASIYSVRAPTREGFGELVWDRDEPRAGILTHLSMLALHSHPVASSATLRGAFVRTQLMCDTIPPPPVDVNTALPEPTTDAPTLRERVQIHLTDPSCRGCHSLMDPIGLALENYDALGQYRTTENGALIDPSGDIDGAEFADALELGEVLAADPKIGRCMVRTLYRFANSRPETLDERDLLTFFETYFEARGYRILDLMEELAMSPGFRFTTAPAQGGE